MKFGIKVGCKLVNLFHKNTQNRIDEKLIILGNTFIGIRYTYFLCPEAVSGVLHMIYGTPRLYRVTNLFKTWSQ